MMARALVVTTMLITTLIPTTNASATASCGGSVRAARVVAGLPLIFDYLAWRESRCNPNAVSRTHDYGVWQINRVNLPYCRRRVGYGSPFNVRWNARCAAALYRLEGLRPWR